MHRCWLQTNVAPSAGDVVTLSVEESAHMTRVLRMKPGDEVQLIAGERLLQGELLASDDQTAQVRVLAELPSPECPVRITLVQGLPKLDKLETIIQKATELGVWDVLPVEMERSVARLDGKEARKRERLERIALEAAKQSGRAHIPEVRTPCGLTQALQTLQKQAYDLILVAWEEEGSLRLSEAVARHREQQAQMRSLALVIGPEGGMGAGEVERWQAIGARCVTLGRRILRTETAGLCALAVTMCALGEL